MLERKVRSTYEYRKEMGKGSVQRASRWPGTGSVWGIQAYPVQQHQMVVSKAGHPVEGGGQGRKT